MTKVSVHREDVRAELRKRHGTIAEFARVNGVSPQVIKDFFRGKSNAAKRMVARELGLDPDHMVLVTGTLPPKRRNSTRSLDAQHEKRAA